MKFRSLLGGGRLLASTAALLINDEASASKPAADEGGDSGVVDPPADPEESAADPADPVDPADPADPADPVDPPSEDEVELPTDPAALAAFAADRELAGRSEMAARISAVFASEHVVGREAAAAELLADDLGSDRIISLLAKMPKGSTAVPDIRGGIRNPELEAADESQASVAKASAGVWDKALKQFEK